MHEDKIDRVIFVEVKTGSSKLTKREKSLKETIEKKRVGWKEINIDTADDNIPDKDMTNEDTSIKDLYDKIEQRVSSVKNKVSKLEEHEVKEIEGEDDGKNEWEDLADDDIEDYVTRVMEHPEFPEGEVSYKEALKFIKNNYKDICEELDERGLEIIAQEIENETSS